MTESYTELPNSVHTCIYTTRRYEMIPGSDGDDSPTLNTLNTKLDSILDKLNGMETQFSELKGTVSEQQKSIKKIEDQVADNIEKLFLLEDRMNQITPT